MVEVKNPIDAIAEAIPYRVERKTRSFQEDTPIDYIGNGIVRLKDGSALAIMRITPVNFFLLSEEEQAKMVRDFEGIIKLVEHDFQIITSAEYVNIQEYVEELREKQ